MCADTTTCASAMTAPAPILDRGRRFAFTVTILAMIEAWQEALAMRRAAAKSYRGSGE
jgi:hypothetical protein